MSERNAELFREMVAAAGRGDEALLLTFFSEDVVFLPLRAGVEGGYKGHQGLRQFVGDNADSFSVFEIAYDELLDLGDQLLAVGTVHSEGRGSGVATDVPSAGLATFRDGLIVKWQDFGDRDAALAAAERHP